MGLLVSPVAERGLTGIIGGLRTVRIEADISQDALASVLPVRGRAISEWETEAIAPTFNNLLLLTGALGQRLVIVRQSNVLASVERRAGESWVEYERRRLAWPLRCRRRALGMSQTELGELVGVSKDSVQRWELATVPPRPIAKVVWAHALGCLLELRRVGQPDLRIRRGSLQEGMRITDRRRDAETLYVPE